MMRATVRPEPRSASPATGRLHHPVQALARPLAVLAAAIALAIPGPLQAQQEPSVDLTPEERAWLAENPIRVGPAPNYPPMEFFDEDGVYRGIVADYVAVFEERLGVEIEIVQYPTWNDVVEAMKRGDIDVWMEAADTEERREYMLFTEPYLRLPVAIIVRQEDYEPLTVEDLSGRRVAAVEGYAVVDYLRERAPGIDLVEVPSVSIGLERLSFGGVDALVASTATAEFYGTELGITTLRVAGKSGFEWILAIGSRKDEPILHDILRKTLDSIGPAERRALYRGWVTLDEGVASGAPLPPWVIGLAALLVAALVVGVILRRRGRTTQVRLEGTRSAWPVYLAAAVGVMTIVVLAWWAENQIAVRMREDVGDALQTVLNTTSKAVYQWFGEREEEARIWARHAEVQEACRLLSDDVGNVSGMTAQTLLEDQLADLATERGYTGFHLVAPSGEKLSAADRHAPAGARLSDAIESLREMAAGSARGTAIELPLRGDSDTGSGGDEDAIMLVGAQVGDDRTSMCLLVFEIDPELDFTEILQRGRIGESGESYAFNSDGQMISDSRFVEDLRRLNLLEADQNAVLAIDIRDPGGNLVTGFRTSVSRSEQPLTRMAASAVGGRAGADLDGYRDYRGVPVVGAWVWDETLGFGMATEIDESEAFESLLWVRRMHAGGAVLVVGLIIALTGAFRADDNRRRRLEATMRRQSAALGAAVDGIAITDLDGTIVWVNPAFADLTGYSMEEALGQNPRILKSESQDPAFYRKMWETIKEGRVWSGEVVNRRKDGSLYTEEMSITPVRDADGSIVDFVAIKRDITRRKAMEAELERARARMEQELNVGREIQMSMLPLIFPPYPRRQEFDVYARLEPAREVGGDFYDFFLIDEGLFGFCVGDVSGKGVPAALFMAVTKTLIEARARTDPNPASILTHVNDEISANNDACMFVTIFLGILDTRTGDVRYANAGHNPPYIKRRNGELVRLGERHGPVIGALEGMVYGSDRTHLATRDLIFLYTDGVTEAMDSDQALYGEQRLESLVSERSFGSLKELVDAAVEDVSLYEGGAEQTDDVTVLAVEFFGSDDNAVHDVLELRLSVLNRLEEIRRVIEAFGAFTESHSIPDSARRSVNVALDELLNNTISYAFDDDADHMISVRVELSGDRLNVTLCDDGAPFNPFAVAAPDSTLTVEERPIGGLGIHLVQNVMDEVSYHRRPRENVVSLTKYLEEPSTG